MDRFHEILKQYWGYDDFRGIQAEIIESITTGNDTLGLMPTGGGKSITFQVPALALEGMTIVITPLIALMKDQVANLKKRGIQAAAIYSGQTRDEILKHLDNSIFGAYKLLYVSPERLGTEIFQNKVKRMKVSFITVDEAHCISQWGYDFRPSYLQISQIRQLLPEVPVLALTATATPAVVDDICAQLHFREGQKRVFRMSFARRNLYYVVRKTQDKETELFHILRNIKGAAIVYTRSRKGTSEVAEKLRQEGFTALHYHAGLSDIDKDVRQKAWQNDEVRIMVATNAFGMGIDKPDVRVVVHMDLPDSVEAYFQEAGRGGRDGKPAYAVLLYNRSDHGKMLRRIPETFPTKEYIADVYDKLAYFFQLAVGDGMNVNYEFNLQRFCVNFKLFPVPVLSALRILTQAGYIDFREEEENTSRLLFLTGRDDLYRLHQLQGAADRVIKGVLRLYGGIFSDYVPIDEQRLGAECEMTPQEVYDALVLLTKLRIIHYIPHKNVPHITYLQRRVERATLSQEVYEERRDDYLRRINAILNYAEKDDRCRSRILLDYFGETKSEDCGHCDVCVERRKEKRSLEEVCHMIETMMADGHPRQVDEFCSDRFSKEKVAEALQYLTDEEILTSDDGFYRMVEGKNR